MTSNPQSQNHARGSSTKAGDAITASRHGRCLGCASEHRYNATSTAHSRFSEFAPQPLEIIGRLKPVNGDFRWSLQRRRSETYKEAFYERGSTDGRGTRAASGQQCVSQCSVRWHSENSFQIFPTYPCLPDRHKSSGGYFIPISEDGCWVQGEVLQRDATAARGSTDLDASNFATKAHHRPPAASHSRAAIVAVASQLDRLV